MLYGDDVGRKEYATISVPKWVKKVLEKGKRGRDWGEYLYNFYMENERWRRLEAFNKLKEILSKEEINNVKKSSKEFRDRFKFVEG